MLYAMTESHDGVAERVRWHRQLLGLTQQEYADAIGAQRSQVKNWEAGTRRPSIDFGLKLSARYGVTLDWLYRGRDEMLPPSLFESWRSSRTK